MTRMRIVVLALLVSACASPGEMALGPDLATVTAPPGQGLVVLRVTMNAVGPTALRGATVRLMSYPDKADWFVQGNKTNNATTAVFVRALPPGKYSTQELTRGQIRSPLPFGQFEVRPAEITDLGAIVLVYQKLGGPRGQFRVAKVPSPEDSDAALSSLNPELRKQFARIRRATIEGDLTEGDVALAKNGKLHSTILSRSRFMPGQHIAFGRALGMVSVWNPATKRWAHLDTGRSFGVHSVCFDKAGNLYAGLEEGVLLVYAGTGWRQLPAPAKGATILSIGQTKSGEYVAVVQDRAVQKVLTTTAPDSGAWKEIYSLPLFAGTLGLPSPVVASMSEEHLMVIHYGSDRTVHVLDLDKKTWQTVPTSEYLFVHSVLADGSIVAFGGTGFSPKLIVSRDWGKSWTSKSIERGSQVGAFRSTAIAYIGKVDGLVTQVMMSRNGGDTWEGMGNIPTGIQQLHVLPDDGWLAATNLVNNMYVSRDDGKTWELEF